MDGLEKLIACNFYRNKRVLVTGHTGFKGSWMCQILLNFGAEVIGYALEPPTEPSLFEIISLSDNIESINGDIRDNHKLSSVLKQTKPDIVIHMAAQSLVRESYIDPINTYLTNVMGTVHILDAVRQCDSVRSIVNITTDKVYQNNEWEWGYRENDVLDGHDPYSNSKSCAELVTSSYRKSFFENTNVAISTVRAGNVIGGGDFAKDRIIPDCLRAVEKGEDIVVRNPHSVRPYQHVLEPVFAYLLLAYKQYEDISYASSYNIGPDDSDCVTTGTIADLFCKYWGHGIRWISQSEKNPPHEANYLKLECSKAKKILGWRPKYNIEESIKKTVKWSKNYIAGDKTSEIINKQIKEYIG